MKDKWAIKIFNRKTFGPGHVCNICIFIISILVIIISYLAHLLSDPITKFQKIDSSHFITVERVGECNEPSIFPYGLPHHHSSQCVICAKDLKFWVYYLISQNSIQNRNTFKIVTSPSKHKGAWILLESPVAVLRRSVTCLTSLFVLVHSLVGSVFHLKHI